MKFLLGNERMRTDRMERLRVLSGSDRAKEGAVAEQSGCPCCRVSAIVKRGSSARFGLSESTISRMNGGSFAISPDTKPFELAQLFVRLFRSLDAIMGSDDAASQSWLRTDNIALGGKPIDLIQNVTGLLTVLQYVDSRRAPI